MTSQFPVRTRSLADAQRNENRITSQQRSFDIASSTRPLSWHPTFTNDLSQYQVTDQQFVHSSYQPSPYTTFAYGLVTPNTYPTEVEPYPDCVAIPLDQLTEQDYHYLQNDFPTAQTYHDCFNQDLVDYAPSSAAPVESMEYGNPPWPSVQDTSTYNITTAPASPINLPVLDMGQSFDFPETIDDVDGKEELVGMGLYDSPNQVQSSSLLFSGSLPVRRKNLKLEESFEPPPDDCDATDADAEAESIQAEDDLCPQEELNRSQMFPTSEQLQSNFEAFNSVFINQNGQPYLVRDLASADYHGDVGENYTTTYGWF